MLYQRRYAGEFISSLSPGFDEMKTAVVQGTIAASFTCESFSADSLFSMDESKFRTRLEEFLNMVRIPSTPDF